MKRAFLLALVLLLLVVTLAAVADWRQPGGAALLPVSTNGEEADRLDAYPWVYGSDGGAAAPGVDVILVGDVMFGREGEAATSVPPDALAAAAPWLRSADLVLGNLESPLVAAGRKPLAQPHEGGPYILRGGPQAAPLLAEAGFDLLGLANNHAFDFGQAGLEETRSHLQAAELEPLAGQDPLFLEVDGVQLAFLAFNQVAGLGEAACTTQPGAAPCRLQQAEMEAAVRAAAAQADGVVVSLHWGYEYELRPDPAQERLAQALLAAGADLLVGHHPHVAQPLAVTEAGVVAYSLGNFLFDQGAGETGKGLALRARFDEEGLQGVQLLPVWAGLQPRLMEPDAMGDFLARVSPPPPRLAFACDATGCAPSSVLPQAGEESPLFWSGQIDLTGDGRLEQVRRAGSRVGVYEDGALAWESPPEWEVVDLALGDPNDDGRNELLLAVWKPDAAGYRRSHPYLVGYRGGEYTLMWGGRAVVEPIQELALADVDGDGVQELLVLAEQPDGSGATVDVWRWHGWGFSLVWRSEPDAYQGLLVHPQGEGPVLFSVARERG